MRVVATVGLAVAAALAAAAPTSAQGRIASEPASVMDVELLPWARYDGVERPYRFILELRPWGDRPVDVVADRRLLAFEIREGRRVHRCVHPAAPARVSEPRVRTLVPGEPEGVWREWVDLRMYCVGAARDALMAGAEVQARFGWARRARDRWVARRAGDPASQWLARAPLPPIRVGARPARRTRFTDRPDPAPVEVTLTPASARTGRALALTVRVRAREGSARLFVRPDSWHFRVRGPLGDVRCQMPAEGGPPPPELFRRVTARSPLTARLDPGYFCPPGTFDVPGVYEVTPKLWLPYGGDEWGFAAVEGDLSGVPTAIRITHGDGGYVEQIPEPANPPGAAGE